MTANFTLDQELGKKNVVKAGNFKLGETGLIRDLTKTGTSVVENSGMMVEVMIVQASAPLTAPAGLGVKFDTADYGKKVGSFSGAGEICHGIVDPNLVGNIATNDTFLIFRKGPMPIISSAAISAGAGVKSAASGKFQTASEMAPTRQGFLMVAAGAGDQVRRAYMDFTVP